MNQERMYRVLDLARSLADIGEHAAAMQSAEEDRHDACPWCETAVLLARVVSFGRQERDRELQEIPRERTA